MAKKPTLERRGKRIAGSDSVSLNKPPCGLHCQFTIYFYTEDNQQGVKMMSSQLVFPASKGKGLKTAISKTEFFLPEATQTVPDNNIPSPATPKFFVFFPH
ncbi:MAG: hypothetical protein NT121_03030 [Chloroflexi bacterium]|nr:hypothetical protein [Chloroflexota bacterium]